MAEKKTKKQKSSEFIKKHKKSFIGVIVLIVCFCLYVFCDYEVSIDALTEKVCSFIGC